MEEKTPVMKTAMREQDQDKEALIRELRESVKKASERIRKSERLTAEDYAVRINVSQ